MNDGTVAETIGACCGVVAGRGFDSRWCHCNFSV